MTDRKMIVPALAGVLGMAAMVSAAEPTAAELRSQIDALTAKVAQIEAKEVANAQATATVSSVLDDAQKRSQLMDVGGLSGGHDENGFWLGTANGDFRLNPYFNFQFREVANYRDSGKVSGDNDLEFGGEVRRMQVGVKGNAFGSDLGFNFRYNFGKNDGASSLELAYVTYKVADAWTVKVGQYKANVFHEETLSDTNGMAVERSLLNDWLGGSLTKYVQGVALMYSEGNLRGEIAYTDGGSSSNTDFTENNGRSQYGVDGRIEYLVNGDWADYNSFTARGNKADLLVVGGGFDYTEFGDTNRWIATIDGQWENAAGLGLYAAGIYNRVDNGSSDSDNWGVLVQASYGINENVDIFARYDMTHFDSGSDNFSEISVGGTYFLHDQHAKITVDLNWLPDGAPASGALDYLSSSDTEIVLRTQFQLAL